MAINNKFTRKYSDWVDSWRDRNVQDLNSTYDFVSSESTLLVSGPPEYVTPSDNGIGAAISDDSLIPIGLVQAASIGQQKMVQQLNEIGSRQMFIIPGRVSVNASVQRILFDGPSLLFAMSTYYKTGDSNTIYIPNVQKTSEGDPTDPYIPATDDVNGYTEVPQSTSNLGAFWGNLGSTVFNKPMGLGFIFLDTESQFYGGLYLEKCYIATYNIGISAQQTLLLENVGLRASRVRPIRIGAAG